MLTRKDMHGYQRHSVQHVLDTPKCALFLDMGLGKTVSTLTAIDELIYARLEIRKVLVVAPKRVAESVWAQEVAVWDHLKHLRVSLIAGTPKQRKSAIAADADVYAVSRDNIAWLCGLYGGSSLPFDMLVLDELSSFKSHKSQRFKALRQVVPSFSRVVGLTGTPSPNGLIDLWPQIYLLDRGERLGKTITFFRNRFFRPDQKKGRVVYSYKPLTEAGDEIHNRISDLCISMRAADYLEMPEFMEIQTRIDMPDGVAEAYKVFEKEKVLELSETDECVTAANAAGLVNKLLQYAGGALYDEDRRVHEVHRLKIDALRDAIEEANGKPVIVAYAFRHELDRLRAEFPQAGELKTDADVQKWNRGETPVLLVHPAGCGHGLNLQAGGNHVVWYGHTWSLELYQQLNTRVFRQGQRSGFVVVQSLVLSGTADEDVVAALANKATGQNALLEALKARISKYIS